MTPKIPRSLNILLGLLLIAPTLACSAGPQLRPQWTSRAQFERAVGQLTREENGPPGVNYIVSQHGRISSANTFGTLGDESGTPMSHAAAFQWWSVTKVVTAIAVLQLAERGKLHLNHAISEYLPEFQPEPTEEGEASPTIRQLLNHSSGLDDIGMKILSWIHTEEQPRRDQRRLLKKGLALRPSLKSPPGTRGAYSNLGYLTLAVLIEKVSGKTYEDYVRENILQPLNMTRTDFVYTDAVTRVEAKGTHPRDAMGWLVFRLILDEDKVVERRDDQRHYFQRVYSDQLGATGLIGPATDLLILGETLLQGGTRNGVRILKPSSVQLMATATLDSGRCAAVSKLPMRFGGPWFIENHPEGTRLSHAGVGMGFVTFLQLRPETQTVVVVMGNGTYLDGSWGETLAEGAVRFSGGRQP